METFSLRMLLLLSCALLGCVVQSIESSAITGLSLVPMSTTVPLGGQFQMHCTGMTESDCGVYQGWLYKVMDDGTGDFTPVQALRSLRYYDCICSRARCFPRTTFVITADTVEATGTYGCVMLRDGPPTETTVARGLGVGRQPREANVTVCSEPDLILKAEETHPDTDHLIQVEEKCGFLGEVSWIVNGNRVPRNSLGSPVDDPSLPAFQRDDDSLVIRHCEWSDRANHWCNVKAEFKCITSSSRLEVATQSLNLSDCCLSFSSTEAPPIELFQAQRPEGHPTTQGTIEETPSEMEKWALEKEVFELRKELLPLQIRFFKNWGRVNPKKIRDAMESGALDDI